MNMTQTELRKLLSYNSVTHTWSWIGGGIAAHPADELIKVGRRNYKTYDLLQLFVHNTPLPTTKQKKSKAAKAVMTKA